MARLKQDNSEDIAQIQGYIDALDELSQFIELCEENAFGEKVTLKVVTSLIETLKETAEEKKDSL